MSYDSEVTGARRALQALIVAIERDYATATGAQVPISSPYLLGDGSGANPLIEQLATAEAGLVDAINRQLANDDTLTDGQIAALEAEVSVVQPTVLSSPITLGATVTAVDGGGRPGGHQLRDGRDRRVTGFLETSEPQAQNWMVSEAVEESATSIPVADSIFGPVIVANAAYPPGRGARGRGRSDGGRSRRAARRAVPQSGGGAAAAGR